MKNYFDLFIYFLNYCIFIKEVKDKKKKKRKHKELNNDII